MHAPSDASSLSEVYHANRHGDGESTDGDEDAAMAPGRVLRVRTRPPRSKVSMQPPFFGPEPPPWGRSSCLTTSCHCLLQKPSSRTFCLDLLVLPGAFVQVVRIPSGTRCLANENKLHRMVKQKGCSSRVHGTEESPRCNKCSMSLATGGAVSPPAPLPLSHPFLLWAGERGRPAAGVGVEPAQHARGLGGVDAPLQRGAAQGVALPRSAHLCRPGPAAAPRGQGALCGRLRQLLVRIVHGEAHRPNRSEGCTD
jgi:hypothetical protein